MARWLVKGDPDDYGFADLLRDRRTLWDGIRSAPAQLHLRAMRRSDDCFFYETGRVKAIVGRCRVVKGPAPDPGDETKVAVEIAARSVLSRPVALAEIKADPFFSDFALVRISRLSVMPVSEAQWSRILEMAGA